MVFLSNFGAGARWPPLPLAGIGSAVPAWRLLARSAIGLRLRSPDARHQLLDRPIRMARPRPLRPPSTPCAGGPTRHTGAHQAASAEAALGRAPRRATAHRRAHVLVAEI